MSRVIRRKKNEPRRQQYIDPAILAALPDIPPEDPELARIHRYKEDARKLIKHLIKREELELEPGVDGKDLAEVVAKALAADADYDEKASMISDALINNELVADLFIDDEHLSLLLKGW